jgi:hypothetical protein
MKIIGYIFMIAGVFASLGGGWSFIAFNKKSDPKEFIGITMVALFIFVTTSTMGLIVLATCNPPQITLDASFLKWLGGATIAEVAGIVTLIVKAYFTK